MNKVLTQDADSKDSIPKNSDSTIADSKESNEVTETNNSDTKNIAQVSEKKSTEHLNIRDVTTVAHKDAEHKNEELNKDSDIEIQGPTKESSNESTPPEKYEPLPLIAISICTVAGSYLFNVYGFAVNVVIFSTLLALLFVFVHRPQKPKRKALLVIASGSIFVISFAWRESSTLIQLNFIALLSLILITLSRINNKSHYFYLIDLFSSFFAGFYTLLISPVTKTRQEIKHIGLYPGLKRSLWGVLRGLAISLPFVFLAGTLLISADTGFSQYLDDLFSVSFSLPTFTVPLIISVFIAIAFLTRLKPYQPLKWYQSLSSSSSLPGMEVVTILTSLNIVFALYIKVQISYYFGDDAMIQNTNGIAYAEYARTGFFQLVSLSIVVLGFLWSLAWFMRKDVQIFGFWFKIMALIMIGLLTVIEASAIHRMILYTNAYGLTEARFYALALMLWVGLIYIIFALTILKSKRGQFLANALACGMGIVIILNFINPAALITQYNLTHTTKNKVDIYYLTNLGPDAYPTIINNINLINQKNRCVTVKYIEGHLRVLYKDWRNWSWGIQNTRKALSNLIIKCPSTQQNK